MQCLADTIASSEDWLVHRILAYAKKYHYVDYASPIQDVWRISIAGLSRALQDALQAGMIPDVTSQDDFRQDPICAFGVREAQRHRARGTSLGMFLSLLKYFRLTFLDLVRETHFPPESAERYRQMITLFFDRLELGVCTEWADTSLPDVVDELKNSNRGMMTEKAKYLSIFEHMPSPVLLFSSSHALENANRAAIEIFTECDLSGMLYYTSDSWKDALQWLADTCLPLLIHLRHEQSLERVLQTRQGMRYFHIQLKHMRDSARRFIGTLVIFTDLTERQQLQTQMLHTQKMESMGVLAGGIAHDFNNLLMGILGNTEMAMMSLSSNAHASAYLERIMQTTMRAAELAKQMLTYSGKGQYHRQSLHLSTLIQDMAQLLTVAVGKSVCVRFELATEMPPVNADPSQLQQIVMNLITNAAEAIGETRGEITLRTGVMTCSHDDLSTMYLYEALAEGEYAFLEVIDTGCGMDDETLSRIFDPFYSTKFTGRGLGMAAVLGIVRAHLGAIRVTSDPGEGTTVHVLLPLASPRAGDDDGRPEAGSGKGTVVLIDEDDAVRQTTTSLLENLGYAVLAARDSRMGRTLFLQHSGDVTVILLDASDEEAVQSLKAAAPDTPILLSSGYSSDEARRRFNGWNLAGFIQKPYTLTSLMEALARVVDRDAFAV